ncbi:UL52 DNA helicase-primase associated protein [Meleagrid alphaherpesvirus 1]|uniref:UL52 DNA helicase-primase associated protein n=1 Tax=Meleagrid herpesvirus 1 TaxID=37108 RepID=Q9DGY9_MEHV1|nr:helicase-primase primase subunit [Meleagrid alphaherpesvirus 1]AKQ48586.1 helicase-primase primase subunit [iBAC vector pMeHV1-C7]AKQ48658.1 helicase-primase primase subunit [iBAC vector pMeHV1-C9]AKQ48730.1 helicase-primase primase subunit [iBAC vector pMeHV1-C10]AKQ48802.1 helicase-primase primase subunit [iBAC vector pMeHV1-C17]AKQ48874.1 helicase-primase primase subunit [iBAC vector pMeHV1-C18]
MMDQSLKSVDVSSESVSSSIKVLFAVDGCAVSFTLGLLTGQISSTNMVYIIAYWDPDDVLSQNTFLAEVENNSEPRSTGSLTLQANTESLRIEFCLLNQMTSCMGGADMKLRTRPIFICRFKSKSEIGAILSSITHGLPIQADLLASTVCEEDTFMLHDDFNLALHISLSNLARSGRNHKHANKIMSKDTVLSLSQSFRGGKRGLTALYLQHEQKVTAAYRRIYGGSTTTAFWYVSKFGPDEKSLVLALRYYLLQAQDDISGAATDYDLQAIKDVCRTYDIPTKPNPTHFSTADLTSFARLSRFCCSSDYARGAIARAFPTYVEHRIIADVSEVDALREYIERDRPSLKISDLEFVRYIYLAYFECYNRKQLKRHLEDVTVKSPYESIYQKSSLGRRAVENFFTHVRSRLSVHDHITKNVSPEQVELGEELGMAFIDARTYSPCTMTMNSCFMGLCECATLITKRLDRLETKLQKHGWPCSRFDGTNVLSDNSNVPHSSFDDRTGICDSFQEPALATRGGPMIVKRLLAMVSSDGWSGNVGPISMLMGLNVSESGPLPVYRVSMAKGKQAFVTLAAECWERVIPPIGTIRDRLSRLNIAGMPTDDLLSRDRFMNVEMERILGLVGTEMPYIACGPAEEQRYINRNEVFNENLVVCNIVLDVDVHLKQAIPSSRLHAALRGFRSGTLRALSLLLPKANLDLRSYPCYFYKSSCKKSQSVRFARWTHLTSEYTYDYEGSCTQTWDFDTDISIDDPLLIDQMDESASRWTSDSALSAASDADIPCGCQDKIGMRVCIPVPPPYLLIGSATLGGISRIIQQAVLMERDFVETIGPYLKNYDIIDVGVYGHGRSLRLPFFSKIGDDGLVSGRLMPIYVLPDICENPDTFVLSHFDPRTFHFHSPRMTRLPVSTVIKNLGGEYAIFFEKKLTVNRDAFFGVKRSLSATLRERGIDVNSEDSIIAFVTDFILEDISRYMNEHMPECAVEYRNMGISGCVVRTDRILIHLIPNTTASRGRGFTCMRYKHTRSSRTSARSYLALNVDAHGRLCVCVIQQCFATKCGNNKLRTLFTVDVDSKCRTDQQ